LFLLTLGGSFLLLLAGPVRAQRDEVLLDCWRDVFPDWQRPWSVPGWWLLRLTEVFRYACEPVGNLLTPLAAAGALALWRGGRRRLVVFLVVPVVLPGLAALAGQYPFGATRVMAFAAPAALLLVAAGLPAAFAWLKPTRLGPALLAGVLLVPVAQAGYRVVCPWTRAESDRAAAFVHAQRLPDEPVL